MTTALEFHKNHDLYFHLESWQQRVVDEAVELKVKTGNLTHFFQTPQFSKLSKDDQDLLIEQWEAMQKYGYVLEKRIDKF